MNKVSKVSPQTFLIGKVKAKVNDSDLKESTLWTSLNHFEEDIA